MPTQTILRSLRRRATLAFGAVTVLGATIVLYDGAIDYPASDRLWGLIAEHRVSVLGVTPTLIRVLMHAGDAPPVSRNRWAAERGSITRTGCERRKSSALSSSCSVTRSTVRVSCCSVASFPGRSSATLCRMDDV